MIYQVRTYDTLCRSKKYFLSNEEIKNHIQEVTKQTEKFRKLWSITLSESKTHSLPYPIKVTKTQIQMGVEITCIEENTLQNWQSFFGEPAEISDPLDQIKIGASSE